MIISQSPKDKLKFILSYFGHDLQRIKACEEYAECIQALIKDIQFSSTASSHDSKLNVISEIADVWIMTQQLMMIYGEEAVNDMIAQKLNRTVSMIERNAGTS